MTQPSPPRSQQSLPLPVAPVNAFRRLVGAQGVPMLVAGALVTVFAYRDADEIVGRWMVLWATLGIPSSLALAWLAARIDRRVAQRAPVGRAMWLPAAAAGFTLTTWGPLLAVAPVQLLLWMGLGSRRHFEGMLAGTVPWAIVIVAAIVWALSLRALGQRRPGRRHLAVHLTDTVPTSVVGATWAACVFAGPSVAMLATLQTTGLLSGLVALVGWAVFVAAAASAAVAGVVRPVAPSASPDALREVVGAVLVAGWGAVFACVVFTPGWTGHEDQRWIALILTSMAILAGTGLWSFGRADRQDALVGHEA